VAVTRSADAFRLYIQGKEVAATTTTHHITQPYNPVPLLIAARFQQDGVTRGDYFRGRIREFRIYNEPWTPPNWPASPQRRR